MAIKIQGNAGVTAEVESASRSLLVSNTPRDWGTKGYYAANGLTGTMTAGLAATSPIFSFRWTSTSVDAIVKRIIVSAWGTATAFVGGNVNIKLFPARSFTASDSSGTALTVSGDNQKLRTSFATTAVGDIRVAAAGTLIAGTRTVDANAIACVATVVSSGTWPSLIPSNTVLWEREQGQNYPLLLKGNEGFLVTATVPGTGTWLGSVTTEWFESTGYTP